MDPQTWERLITVEPVIRRILRPRVDPSAVDDLVQETLERLSSRMEGLTADQLSAYAATSALNAAASHHRTNARHRRLEPSLLDLSVPDGIDDQVVASEEANNLRAALGAMDPVDQELLQAHHVNEEDIGTLARRYGRSEMAVRLSLARARAKLRVDYTLARQGGAPPTGRCRPVLLALSSGDRRAQQRLDTDEHLERCPVCSDLVSPATGLQRPAVGMLALLAWKWKSLSTAGRSWLSVGGATTTAVAVAAVVILARPATPPPEEVTSAPTTAPAPAPTVAPGRLLSDDDSLPSSPSGLGSRTGQQVDATSVPVMEVPADEGFWIQADDGGTVWVQLVDAGPESTIQVTPASPVTFAGTLVAHDLDYASKAGLDGPTAGRLNTQGAHLEVRTADIRIG